MRFELLKRLTSATNQAFSVQHACGLSITPHSHIGPTDPVPINPIDDIQAPISQDNFSSTNGTSNQPGKKEQDIEARLEPDPSNGKYIPGLQD